MLVIITTQAFFSGLNHSCKSKNFSIIHERKNFPDQKAKFFVIENKSSFVIENKS